jgi:hypothetical protein
MKKIAGILLVFVLAVGLAGVGWYFTYGFIAAKPEYRLDAERVNVPPLPEWIPPAFVKDVLSSAGLDKPGLLLDKTLVQKLTDAFAAYPWVEGVRRVELRYPSGTVVDVEYRKPVAFVEVPKQGLYPVDKHGILLPTDYFARLGKPVKDGTGSTAAAVNMVTSLGIQTVPLGTAGTPWGDPLVQDAAQLAGIIGDDAVKLKITQIIPTAQQTPAGIQVICTLKTLGKTEIIWGVFVSDEAQNETKKRQLWELSERYRSLDNIPVNLQPVKL